MKLEQTFDCQDMPEDVKKWFFDYVKEHRTYGNDVWIRWYFRDEAKPISEHRGGEIMRRYESGERVYIYERGDNPVDDWLQDNGCTTDPLIKHWW